MHLMNKGSSFIHRFRLTILIATVILILSLMPGSSLPGISWGDMVSLDKWAHFIMYGSLSFVWAYEWLPSDTSRQLKRYIMILTATAVFGVMLESLQLILNSDRYFEVLDIIANIIGSMAGLTALHWLIKK